MMTPRLTSSIGCRWIDYFESTLILAFIMLKTTDYWIQNDGGSEFLPEKWIYFSQISVNNDFQKLLATSGLICSMLKTYSISIRRVFPVWSIVSGCLWIIMLLLPFNVGRVAVSFSLCLVSIIQIMSKLIRNTLRKTKPSSKITSNPSANTSSIINPPCDLDISKLDLGTSRKVKSPKMSPATLQSLPLSKPRPIISPSRFSSSGSISSHGNLTKASWVAGGYWQSNNWPAFTSSPSSQPNTTFTRSSSQSSGFGSIQAGFVNRSPPDSRPDSTLEELDRFSVFSDNVDARFSDSGFRYTESPPNNVYPYVDELLASPKPIVPSISSLNESLRPTSSNSNPTNQSSCWLPFLLGFSLAVNVCVLSYFCIVHFTQTENVHKLHF